MQLYISEILDKVDKATTDKEKVRILQEYQTPQLLDVLYMAYSPNFEFDIMEVPEYESDDAPIGNNPTSLFQTHRGLYNIGKQRTDITKEKKVNLLIQMLEGMGKEDCAVVEKMIRRENLASRLTQRLVDKAFPKLTKMEM